MKDYEQLYYDLIFENKNLKSRIENLETEIEIYKNLVKPVDREIIKALINYLRNKRVNKI